MAAAKRRSSSTSGRATAYALALLGAAACSKDSEDPESKQGSGGAVTATGGVADTGGIAATGGIEGAGDLGGRGGEGPRESAGAGGTADSAGPLSGGSAGLDAGDGGGRQGTDTGGVNTGGTAGTGGDVVASGGTGGAETPPLGVWKCPSGLTGTPALEGKIPVRVASVPPMDDFNMQDASSMQKGAFGIIEGPVWIGDALYLSEMSSKSYDGLGSRVRLSRILKLDAADQTSVFLADSGSNGLASDEMGNIVAAVHKDGSLTRYPLGGGAPMPIVSSYLSARFNSPNDLALRTDGNVYFSDPTWQAPSAPPQSAARVYRLAPGGALSAFAEDLGNPNGVTLSLNEDYLFVSADSGKRFPIMADGSVGQGEDYAPASGGDGMVIDCAGNLYVASATQAAVNVFDPAGAPVGSIPVTGIQAVTNVAFGGPERKTLFITGLGSDKGLFKVALDIPGRPY